jgi:hypothetical protein
MKYALVIFLVILIISCDNRASKKNVSVIADDSSLTVAEVPTNEFKDSNNNLINKLQGVWAENKDENAAFIIKRDTIIYTENLSNPFKYNIVGDTLSFKYPEGTFKINILKATGDSLVISIDGIITQFYNRRKN